MKKFINDKIHYKIMVYNGNSSVTDLEDKRNQYFSKEGCINSMYSGSDGETHTVRKVSLPNTFVEKDIKIDNKSLRVISAHSNGLAYIETVLPGHFNKNISPKLRKKYGEHKNIYLTENNPGRTIYKNRDFSRLPEGVEFFHSSPDGNSIVEVEKIGKHSFPKYKKGRQPKERDFVESSLTYTSSSGREREVDVMGYSKLEPHLVKVKIKDKERGSGLEFLVRKDNLTSRLQNSKLAA